MPSPLKNNVSLPSLSGVSLKGLMRTPSLGGGLGSLGGNLSLKRRRTAVVGVDIQPGYVAAARAHVNGSLIVDRAGSVPLDADTVREGEVLNEEALAAALRELFANTGLERHVRLGIANQRTVMRTLEVPPINDKKELDTAVRFQAEDQVPMPLANAALAYRPLGVVDTPQGVRQRVLLVAAQKETVERLLGAVRAAGLKAEGIDLSAFALIRSLYRYERDRLDGDGGDGPQSKRVLHINVGGLTNMVIAEGTACRFTRVLSRGLEAIAAEVAERQQIPIVRAREMLRAAGVGDHGLALASRPAIGLMGAPVVGEPAADDAGTSAAAADGGPSVEPAGAQMEPVSAEATTEQQPGAPTVELAGEPGMAPVVPFAEPAAQTPPTDAQGAPGEGAAAEDPSAAQAADEPGVGQMAAVTDIAQFAEAHSQSIDQLPAEQPAGAEPAMQPQMEGVQPLEAQPGAGAMEAAPSASYGDAGTPPVEPATAPADTAIVAPEPVAQPAPEPAGQPEPGPVARPPVSADTPELAEARLILESGVRAIAGEIRNSLDFYQAQELDGQIAIVVLSGPALDIPGFAEVLEQNLGLPVVSETVPTASVEALNGSSPQYLAIAAGLAVEEVKG